MCRLVEGLLTEGDKALTHLKGCETDLRAAENAFTAGAALWAQQQPLPALQYWASGLNQVAKGVTDCDLADQLGFIEQEANVLGFGNVTALDGIIKVMVHGADFYEDLFAAVQAIENHDYRTAGSEMGKVMNELSQWTKGHACNSNFCYIVIGVMQFMGDIQGDLQNCEADFKHSMGNFTAAAQDLIDQQHSGVDHLIHFNHDNDHIKQGIQEIGYGFRDIAQGVSDCHLQELADLLAQLAAKLGIAPEISWVEELLQILINGVHIENEIADACQDWTDKNWAGFGYNIAKLIKTLV